MNSRDGSDLGKQGHATDRTRETMIRLEGVGKTYPDGTTAVASLDLDVNRGELVALVGPSGCGKSTTLRMVNRLIEPTSGRIVIDGDDVTKVNPVHMRRRIGYVIQRVGLFPHLTVAGNVGTVPQLLGWDGKKTSARVHELLELVGLDPGKYADRYPHELSGGQQQRVGVARALAADPPVLLMDEPFGAVDPIARDRLQMEFRRIQNGLHKTVLFVTHDIDEAVRMADRIAVLSQGGHLEQYDTPPTILGAPANDFVADFVGADRGLRRLAVTPIEREDLAHPPTVAPDDDVTVALAAIGTEGYAVVVDAEDGLHGWVSRRSLSGTGSVAERTRRFAEVVDLGASLKRGFSEIVQYDAGWLPVVDGDRYAGVLTPDAVHAALRRSVPDPVPETVDESA